MFPHLLAVGQTQVLLGPGMKGALHSVSLALDPNHSPVGYRAHVLLAQHPLTAEGLEKSC